MTRIRKRKKQNIKINKIAIIAIIVACLFIIYKFISSTKTERIAINANISELNTGDVMQTDIDLLQDEEGKYYIELPEKVKGFFASRYYSAPADDENQGENQNTINQNIANQNTATLAQENTENSDPINNVSSDADTVNENTVSENTINTNTANENTTSAVENNNIEQQDNTESKVEEIQNDLSEEPISKIEKVINDQIKSKEENVEQQETANQDVASQDTANTKENDAVQENNEKETVEQNNNQTTENQNTVTNGETGEDSNAEANNNETVENENSENGSNGAVENPNTETDNNELSKNENTVVVDKSLEMQENDETSSAPEEVAIEENNIQNQYIDQLKSLTEYTIGDRYYLNEEELKEKSIDLQAIYQTKIIDDVILYKQELEVEISNHTMKVVGFIPKGYYLLNGNATEDLVKEYISGVDEFEGADILLAYDVSITNGSDVFQPINFNESIDVSIVSLENLEEKLNPSLVKVINVKEEENQINLEKINLEISNSDTIEFITNEFSDVGAVIANQPITASTVTLDDYQSDYNYYMGKNYTDNFSGTNQNIYSDSNLAKVTINYYGYDYNIPLNSDRQFNPSVKTTAGLTYADSGFYRNASITFQVTNSRDNYKLINTNKNWELKFSVPTTVDLANTKAINGNKFSNITNSGGTYTISGNNWNSWTHHYSEDYNDYYTITIQLSFDISMLDEEGNTIVNPNPSVNATPSSISCIAMEKDIVGYVSGDSSERQTLFTYVKCVPITDGKISLDLIDNPYMDRPAGYGFDGWATHESGDTFSVIPETFLQSVTKNTGGSKDITINLYANWKPANIVFIDCQSGNNNNNTGRALDKPKKYFGSATIEFANGYKTASVASDRELNILVLKNGGDQGGHVDCANSVEWVIDHFAHGFTLTSLYDGVDYRSNSRILFDTSVTIKQDVQFDFLNLYDTTNYNYMDGKGNASHYIIGNTKNLRIGRGMYSVDYPNRNTVKQIQGGPNTITGDAYRLVIESGLYSNVMVARSTAYANQARKFCAQCVIGSDYDRAKENNENLKVYYNMSSGTGSISVSPPTTNTAVTNRFAGKPIFDITIKSGTLGMDQFNGHGDEDGEYIYSGIYVGRYWSATYDNGIRQLILEGGNIANIIGGLAVDAAHKNITKTNIYVKGGRVRAIVGGARTV